MILPDFVLTSRQNKIWSESGLDSISLCRDTAHFRNYPHEVIYNYNSRGFRDSEWPLSLEELRDSIWCFGDSFTVGLGSPLNHTWVNILQTIAGKRCINVSMDGASNVWIARKIKRVIEEINPKTIVVQWSYAHRDEIDDPTKTDEERRMAFDENDNFFIEPTLLRTEACINTIKRTDGKIIHSFIPDWNVNLDITEIWDSICGSSWPSMPTSSLEFNGLSEAIVSELIAFDVYSRLKDMIVSKEILSRMLSDIQYIPDVTVLDWARDKHHYGIVTATKLVNDIIELC